MGRWAPWTNIVQRWAGGEEEEASVSLEYGHNTQTKDPSTCEVAFGILKGSFWEKHVCVESKFITNS